jgi:predicted peroxiredoxin
MVVLSTSLEDGGRRAALAFGVALAALSNGTKVYVFLSLESAVLATPSGTRGIKPRGFSEPLEAYMQHFSDLAGQLEVCSSCYEEYCRDLPKDEQGRPALRAGTTIHSLGIVAERAPEMPVITF